MTTGATRLAVRRVGLAAALALAPRLGAQDAVVLRTAARPLPGGYRGDSAATTGFAVAEPGSRVRHALDRMPLWSAPLASAALPGLGQARLHKDRFVAYLAAEAFLVLQYAKANGEAVDNARNFRAIARDIARRGFPGAHPDTSAWKYYETMEKYLESGFYTLASNGPTVPETDGTTYNGAQWAQARVLFGVPLDDAAALQHPNYPRALARYESVAVPQAYGWSWRNAQLEQDLYRRSIGRSNDAYRRATGDLIAIIANHVISAVDAFSSLRLMQASGGEVRLSASIPIP